MKKADTRRYRRIPLDMPARITVNAMDEYDGRLINISPGDLALQCDAPVQQGDAIVASITDLDIIDGRVARTFADGFAMSFLLSRQRKLQLTEQLMVKVNALYTDGLGDRRNTPRHNEGNKRMVCRLPDGTSLFVKVIDRSVDGLAVDSPRQPPLGTEIHVGRLRGVVIRHTPRGFVVVHEPESKTSETVLENTGHLRAV